MEEAPLLLFLLILFLLTRPPLIHLFPTFYREEQENQHKHFWDGGGEEGEEERGRRFTGCCLSFGSCFLSFSQGAAVAQVHKQTYTPLSTSTPPRPTLTPSLPPLS